MPYNKYNLVPSSAINTLSQIQLQKSENKDPNLLALQRIEKEMHDVLDNPNMSAERKIALYQHQLHRYKNIDKQQSVLEDFGVMAPPPTQPPPGAPPPPLQPLPPQQRVSLRHALAYFPGNKHRNLTILLDHLEQNPDISWTGDQQLIIQGRVIPQSNMLDLMLELLRDKYRKNDLPATGITPLVKKLRQFNIPLAAIRNKDIRGTLWNSQKLKHT